MRSFAHTGGAGSFFFSFSDERDMEFLTMQCDMKVVGEVFLWAMCAQFEEERFLRARYFLTNLDRFGRLREVFFLHNFDLSI